MVRKKLDPRIRALIEAGVKERHRTFFVVVGDRGRDQVVNLHYMLSKASVRARPNVLWCYKKDLGFRTTPNQKRGQRTLNRGGKDDPFKTFIGTTDIRYVYYAETHRILGNTYGMAILQDFEALTPNLLARTIETVEGGGIIVLMLHTMDSLRQLHAIAMDVHKRFRSEGSSISSDDSSADPVARFNERFLLSLSTCENCLVVDDELNVLPISSHSRKLLSAKKTGDDVSDYDIIDDDDVIKQATTRSHLNGDDDADGEDDKDDEYGLRSAKIVMGNLVEDEALIELKESLREVQPAGSLVKIATTMDQARAALTFLDAIGEKSLRTTVSLTAARGRGKSATLGMAIAGAVAAGYSNIFVTAPSPENLRTLFSFVFRGFDAIGFKEHIDYDIIQATSPEYGKAVVRVNVFRAHRQTIQYIAPKDAQKLGQAELLVIDEAAAIPLPMVQKLLGPYLIFLSSTINGYEGTGRSLSLKLIQKLREQSTSNKGADSRQFKDLKLEEPIRYAAGDPVEKWLNMLLCMDAATIVPPLVFGCPHPSQCQLYYVNRDTLFSFHKQSEEFLQRVMALFVSSHYKNSPNDLQLLSDAPAHHLFVLLGPVTSTTEIPDILAAVHVALEGAISSEVIQRSIGRGQRAAGDLIPWTISQQFQDSDFPSLSGARVVRIATHPSAQGMGYGTRALELLGQYYQGDIQSIDEVPSAKSEKANAAPAQSISKGEKGKDLLHSEKIEPRKDLPPLLVPLQQRPAEKLHYLGVSYGLSKSLYNFWSQSGYLPVYVRLTSNDITGEHSCIMLKLLRGDALGVSTSGEWLDAFVADFRRRFASLLSYEFRTFRVALPTTIFITDVVAASRDPGLCTEPIKGRELAAYFSEFDRRRLESYAGNLVDYHVILDLVPAVSKLVFTGRIPLGFSAHQYSTLLGIGLQHKTVDEVAADLGIEVNQLLANFNKAMRKIAQWLRRNAEKEVEKDLTLPAVEESESLDLIAKNPVSASINEDLNDVKATKRSLDKINKVGDDVSDDVTSNNGNAGGDDDGDDEVSMAEKQERLAKALGISGFKMTIGDSVIGSAEKIKGAVPSSISLKIGTKDITKKSKKNDFMSKKGGKKGKGAPPHKKAKFLNRN